MKTSIMIGDCLKRLKELPDESVHCVITSPPYWTLRKYTGEEGMIGMEATFEDHLEVLVKVFREVRRVLRSDGTCWVNYSDQYHSAGHSWNGQHGGQNGKVFSDSAYQYSTTSSLKNKDLMFMPFEVAKILRTDGWWVRRDIPWYKTNPTPESCRDRPSSSHEFFFLLTKSGTTKFWTHPNRDGVRRKPKPDFIYVDKQTRMATRDEPLDWQNDDNWMRKNLWEGHDYFYDEEAVRTPLTESTLARVRQPNFDDQPGGPKDPKSGNRSHLKIRRNLRSRLAGSWATSPHYHDETPGHPKRTPKDLDGRSARMGRAPGWRKADKQRGHGRRHAGFNERWDQMSKEEQQANGANLKDVWFPPLEDIWAGPVYGYTEAHFATFPPWVCVNPIKAGTSAHGVCSSCGAPYYRQVTVFHFDRLDCAPGKMREAHQYPSDKSENRWAGYPDKSRRSHTKDWAPTCSCKADIAPPLVLDPFSGAGTVGLVAQRLGRDSLLLEISPKYAEMSMNRIQSESPLLYEVVVVSP